MRVGVPVGDLLAGMYGAYGVLAALRDRDRTGRGTIVRTSLLAAIVGVHAFQGTRYTVAGEVPVAQGNHHPSICPYGSFTCADGIIQISVGSEALWRRFAPLAGVDPDHRRFARNPDRVQNRSELVGLLDAAFGKQPLAWWLPRLAEIGVPAGEVRTLDRVYEWEQTRSQHLLVDVSHSSLGTVTLPGPPLRFFDNSGTEVGLVHDAPPVLDEDGPAIRDWLDSLDR
jgi:crotonobetainyl-CoA:carnitine CoA-transferase CaiB-like acyl-CoA transferase